MTVHATRDSTVALSEPSVEKKPPAAAQIGRIRQLSEAVLGDADLFLEVTGPPEHRGDASAMIAAFHAVRDHSKPSGHAQRHYVDVIVELRDRPEEKGNHPMEDSPATKRCSRCKQEKPLSEFGKKSSSKDGLDYKCRDCKRAYDNERRSSKKPRAKKAPAGPGRKPEGEDAAAGQQPVGQASPSNAAATILEAVADPPLSKLKLLAAFLDTDLNGAADFCTALTGILEGAGSD